MQRSQLVPAVLLLIAALGFLFLSVRSNTIADSGDDGLKLVPLDQAQAAPDWQLKDAATGQLVRLSDEAKHHPVVFSFWATWCGPCRMELPKLDEIAHKYGSRVAFYGINSSDSPQAIDRFVKQNNLHLTMLSDAQRSAATSYGAESIPMLVVVDTRNKVRAVTVGYDPNSNLDLALSKVLDVLLTPTAS